MAPENAPDESRSLRVAACRRRRLALILAPAAARRPRRRAGARREARAGRPDRRAGSGGRLRLRRAVRPDRHRPPPRRADGRAAWTVEPHRPREDRPVRGRPRRPLRVPPRLSGKRARAGLRLQPLGTATNRGERAGRLRARRGELGKVALQYWFFYPFNDFNNTHEGDWEMIQLVFDAPDAATRAR